MTALSSLGIALWIAGAAVCLFAGGILLAARRGVTRYSIFLLAGGLFTGFLGFDDLFLMHENVLPAFNVPEPITYGTYALIGLAYVAVAWQQILENRYVMFVAAVGLLAASVTINWFFHSENPWRIIAEDGAKFTGICLWITFHISASAKGIEDLFRSA